MELNISSTEMAEAPTTKVSRESLFPDDYETQRMIVICVYPFMILLGTIGNSLSFLIMRRGSLKEISTCFYMSMLALADTGAVLLRCTVFWTTNFTRAHVYLWAVADCKLLTTFYYFFQHFSSSLLVAMSIEKCIALYFPLRTKSICTVKTAKWVTFFIGLILFIFNAQHFIILKKFKNEYFIWCIYIDSVSSNYRSILYKIDSVLYSFAPFAIMGTCNIAMIAKFTMAKCATGGSESTSQALRKSASRGISMLITISLTFIILTGPASIWYAVSTGPSGVTYILIRIMGDLNHVINGFLYCFVGTKFRNELINLLCRRKQKPNRASSTSVQKTEMTSAADSTSKQ